MSDLRAAHRGYNYQDSITAYHLALTLIGKYDSATVDRKETRDDDRFDDLSTHSGSRLVRRQIKSSSNATRVFELQDLTTVQRDLEIDNLVRCYLDTTGPAADEYRLCATWKEAEDVEFQKLLEPIDVERTFNNYPTKTYRLRAELIWPDGSPSIWRRLRRAEDISRQNFLDFAARFVIELEFPPASNDPETPDELELLLLNLLTDTIGIGRYPNHSRNPVDVATQLIQMAARARASGRGEMQTLTQSEVEVAIRLRKDFGRVAQDFPIVKSLEVRRPELHQALQAQLSSRRIILTGPPGSGKSWSLTDLADTLESEGHLVARHYCYLEPGDQQLQRRITTDVLFANLIYDLIHARPELQEIHRPIYSAGPRELEELLRKGVEQGIIGEAALIIDGLDHISRVFAESSNLSSEEVDIVEELAALELPDSICLIIGSQPGQHLDPLRIGAETIEIPDWDFDEIASLASKFDVPASLMKAGLGDVVDSFLENLFERSEGNPLYATFLCRQTLAGFAANVAFDPVTSLREVPLIDGQISRYYNYLLDGLGEGSTASVVADMLGLIDFGLTEQELKAVYLPLARHIPAALSYLSPVLTQVSAQGGVRIYHESFRRFIVERLPRNGGSVANVIAPVIEWLKVRGFYEDAKAYRFLLPCLRRAGRNREALGIVGAQFVSSSVYAGHPRQAIEENLKVATYIAADERDWAALARCTQLLRSYVTCFEEKLLDIELFGRAYAAIFGAASLNERLLFDGRSTFSAPVGLIFCSLIDDAGEVAPWEIYLNLSQEYERQEDEISDSPGRFQETVRIAEAHGLLRLEHDEETFDRLMRYLEQLSSPPVKYLRSLLRRMVQFMGVSKLSRLLDEAQMVDEVRGIVLIELARQLVGEGKIVESCETALQAICGSGSIELAAESLTLGADINEVAKRLPDLSGVNDIFEDKHFSLEPNRVARWVNWSKILAATNPQSLESVLQKIRGDGWYHNWLRFVVALAQAEAQSATDPLDAQASIVRAFIDLSSDTRPFAGDPRACDLYNIHEIIHQTISNGLRLLRDNDAWKDILGRLETISRETTVYLQRSPSGPLSPEAFAEVLMPFISVQGPSESIVQAMRRRLEYVKQGGELYEVQARMELLVARALSMAGDLEAARELWRSAAVHLCAYGFRNDSTIFKLIESAPALVKLDQPRACSAVATMQPLVNAVVGHTDGKGTDYAPVYWIKALGEVDPVAAAILLARSLVKRGGVIDWRHEDSVEQVVDQVLASGDPLLVFYIKATLPFNGRVEDVEKRLTIVERLYERDAAVGEHALRLLAAQVHGDSVQFNSTAYAKIEAFAAIKGIRLPFVDRDVQVDSEREKDYSPRFDPFSKLRDEPVFPTNAPPLQLMATIRLIHSVFTRKPEEHDRFINAFGYRLIELLDHGAEDQAIRLIRYFVHESRFSAGAIPLADIAAGLERHGHKKAAAIAYSIAYASSRGDGDWNSLGSTEHLPWVMQAFTLSEFDGMQTLADEVAGLINGRGNTLGITRHLIELCASRESDSEVAFETWNTAYEVVKHRLPNSQTDGTVFDEVYVPDATSEWTLNEALTLLLLARVSHPELRRKTRALAGFAAIAAKTSALLVRPMREFLSVDTPISSALIVLQSLVESEPIPYPVTLALREELKSLRYSGIFGLRLLAQTLLDRAGERTDTANRQIERLNLPSLPESKKKAILTLDWGNRVENISKIWEDFPGLVAQRFDHRWKASEALMERAKYRDEAAYGRAHNEHPHKPMLFWEQELFESVFHEVLDGIDYHLSENEDWTPGACLRVGYQVLPAVHLHVCNWHSRNSRPPLPLPSDQREGVESVTPIEDPDEYAGWVRCGYYERQLLMSETHISSGERVLTVMAGVEFPVVQGVFDHTEIPLAMGNAESWWAHYEFIPEQPDGFVGCAVGIDLVFDWMGKSMVLALQPSIAARLGLRSPRSWQQQLVLTDTSGEIAVVFRSWHVRPMGDSIDKESPRLEGCDLLMHPNVFEQMRRLGAHPLSIVRWVKRAQ